MMRSFCAVVFVMLVVFPTASQGRQLTEEEATAMVGDAYAYAFPLVLMDVTREKATNVEYPTDPGSHNPQAPMNQLSHFTVYPDASYVDIVAANTDTL